MWNKFRPYFGKITAFVAVFFMLFGAATMFHWNLNPFHYLGFDNRTKTTITTDGPAQIIRIEPEVIDCRTLVTARVPEKGKKDFQESFPFGKHLTYRTDKVNLVAIGDFDGCVGGGSQIETTKDGGWIVTVSQNLIEIHRPRVDAIATANSVRFSKGWFGKISDVFPWISENNFLMPDAYAHAQSVIGGSKCVSVAWQSMRVAIETAYRQQAASKHIDPNKVHVIFTGTPNFTQHDGDLQAANFHDFKFEVDSAHVECLQKADALQQSK